MPVTYDKAVVISVIALCFWFTPSPAFAQSSDSATVDVIATIVSAPAAIEVTATRNLSIGTVSLPDGLLLSCTYSVFPDGGTFISASGGDKSGCSFANTEQQSGQFDIACEPSSDIALSLSFTSDITSVDPAVVFETTEFDTSLDGGSYSSSASCDADGLSTLTVGGSLRVGRDALPTSGDITVGTITLYASY